MSFRPEIDGNVLIDLYRYFLNSNEFVGYWFFNLKTKFNGFFYPLHKCVKRFCLGMTTTKNWYRSHEISIFISFNYHAKFFHCMVSLLYFIY